jgi:hypothetical protein
MTPTPPPAKTPAKSVKLEMTEEQLNMIVYMLGAIDLRTDPDTLTVAMDLRKKLKNALEVFKPKNKPKKDQYGKVMSDEEKATAQQIAAQSQDANAEKLAPPQNA